MNGNVFEINGLECAYPHNNGKAVLRIENLSVPMGKVSMILGLSGSGKSTLIETLGLMNHTINKGTITFFHGSESITISPGIWTRPSELTKIRNRHFSFIFQNDFLMPYYSTEENMLIGRLIQGSEPGLADEMEELNMFCRKMGLNFEEISRKKPSDLSVGQKQRLSFIRAMVKKYSVIFGDEPTGNLDEVNSELLMDVLKKTIGENGHLSAILVSHNIPLSLAKADYIIVLSRKSGELYEILQENVFSRTPAGWISGNKVMLRHDDLGERIRAIVSVNQ